MIGAGLPQHPVPPPLELPPPPPPPPPPPLQAVVEPQQQVEPPEYCYICFDVIHAGDSIIRCRACHHAFHSGHLLTWLRESRAAGRHEYCPACRAEMRWVLNNLPAQLAVDPIQVDPIEPDPPDNPNDGIPFGIQPAELNVGINIWDQPILL